MNTYTINQVRDLLVKNNQEQPKAKYSNNIILTMLNQLSDNTTFEIEPTRGGFELNRGTLVEEIVKAVLGAAVNKSYSGKADVELKNVEKAKFEIPTQAKKIEIKFATTFAPASATQPKTKYVILVVKEGAYLIETKDHKGRYTNNSFLDGERLETLSEMLGL